MHGKKLAAIAVLVIGLVGCAKIPTGEKTTTLNQYDKTGKLINTTTINETNVSPDAISQAASDMVQACYNSFEAEYDIKDAYIAKLSSDDLKDILIFREFRVGLQVANGYNPRDVCKNPETIYTYAKAHDEALFSTISVISNNAFGAAKSMTPFIALWKLGETAAKEAGDLFGDNGTKTDNGRDGVTGSPGATLTGTEETTEVKQNGVTDSTLSPDLSKDDSKTEVIQPETTETATESVATTESST